MTHLVDGALAVVVAAEGAASIMTKIAGENRTVIEAAVRVSRTSIRIADMKTLMLNRKDPVVMATLGLADLVDMAMLNRVDQAITVLRRRSHRRTEGRKDMDLHHPHPRIVNQLHLRYVEGMCRLRVLALIGTA
jgi:hypothetical protein